MTDEPDINRSDDIISEAWEDELDYDDDLSTSDPDDIPAADIPDVEQPVEPFEEDEVALEDPETLEDLPTSADISPDESEMDHNLPDSR